MSKTRRFFFAGIFTGLFTRQNQSSYGIIMNMKKFLPFSALALVAILVLSFGSNFASAEDYPSLTESQITSIKNSCSIIKDNLRTVQQEDYRVYDHLSRYYDYILTNFITPLNIVLVKNNIANPSLTENQTTFASAKSKFRNDYINYNKEFEELVSLDCAAEPVRFYNQLVTTRKARAKVATDTSKLRELTNKQTDLVTNLKESL